MSQDIFRFLESLGVAYERHDHPAVFNMEEADRLVPPLPAAKTKNLFLRDAKGKRHLLVVLDGDKAADLRALAKQLGETRLSFASPERMRKHLKIEPGSVSILALFNDTEKAVRLVVDEGVWKAGALQCHPLVNTSTLVVAMDGIRKFLEATGHEARVVDVPSRG